MSNNLLNSTSISAFCDSMALMIGSGIQNDEAVFMLCDSSVPGKFKTTCDNIYYGLSHGLPFALACEKTYAFPKYMIDMLKIGESTGRLESVLRALGVYYDEESRLFDKIKVAISHPAALLCIMTFILGFTIFYILPVFDNVYKGYSGDLTVSSFNAISISSIIGYVSLGITVFLTLIALYAYFSSRTQKGHLRLLRLLSKFPSTKKAMYTLSLSRFTSIIATYIASGVNSDEAMKKTLPLIDNKLLLNNATAAYHSMIDPSSARSMPQAFSEHAIYEPLYTRMLVVGNRSGGLDKVLEKLSSTLFNDAIYKLDGSIDRIEPSIAAFITITIGATLISVMIPLIGIMGQIN